MHKQSKRIRNLEHRMQEERDLNEKKLEEQEYRIGQLEFEAKIPVPAAIREDVMKHMDVRPGLLVVSEYGVYILDIERGCIRCMATAMNDYFGVV